MAAGSTYTPIATQTLSSNQNTVTFSSISGIYTDLVLIATRKYSNVGTGAENTFIRFNSDSGANYNTTYLTNGPGAGIINNANSLYTSAGGNELAQRFSVDVWNFMNYSNTTTYKSVLARTNNTTYGTDATVGLWRSTSAITSILVGVVGSTFDIGSTFQLFGIAAA